jgi:bifunctional DNA-binding transcriptional regulator/antitoxin component of YhaV-PrlF toxin-antitoxin module
MASREQHFIALQSRGLLALPKSVRSRFRLDEPGAQVELTVREDGVIELRPHVAVPADQSWFWSEDWQSGEREASADIAAGRSERFDDAAALLEALRSR